jgi:hypothetical protein
MDKNMHSKLKLKLKLNGNPERTSRSNMYGQPSPNSKTTRATPPETLRVLGYLETTSNAKSMWRTQRGHKQTQSLPRAPVNEC